MKISYHLVAVYNYQALPSALCKSFIFKFLDSILPTIIQGYKQFRCFSKL
ncbi:hypothetical protein midi_01049 [Candidatus Midichloria mitochondrii IricVA]|uniref:Uncharacterized protein n=1 Tax=Midichloria mitochondrii (strain IricVA) TaxID=696127 RepID=F7XTW7_MIDMI|nr:hypothetical protein midi_01049 [Candidatus Midichloria mitochondrii IricVA]